MTILQLVSENAGPRAMPTPSISQPDSPRQTELHGLVVQALNAVMAGKIQAIAFIAIGSDGQTYGNFAGVDSATAAPMCAAAATLADNMEAAKV